MFTGIIQEFGTVASVTRARGLARVAVIAPRLASRIQPLESVAVNGVCLSVTQVQPPTVRFEVIRETLSLTTLGALRRGEQVNLEPSLSLTDRLNGHLVFGHIDGTGRVAKRRQRGGELILEIRVASRLRKFLIPKGPVAVDGVSLTVGQALSASTFTIHLIPETLRRTVLARRAVGDGVNLELDYLAKLVSQWLRRLPL